MGAQIVGVDLDNTIICYDALFHTLAIERELITSDFAASKKRIRDRIRELPDGDIEWQKLQAEAYGRRIGEANLYPGVREFFESAKRHGVRTFVVSHKTTYASYDPQQVSLREAAMSFLRGQGLLDCLSEQDADVFFADTRPEKCRRVQALGCGVFVDDLLETFLEPEFPKSTERVLFDPLDVYPASVSARRLSSWSAIAHHVFD